LITYQRTASALRRILKELGLKRVTRDISDPLEYAKRSEAAE
jgi:hypothetical protein